MTLLQRMALILSAVMLLALGGSLAIPDMAVGTTFLVR